MAFLWDDYFLRKYNEPTVAWMLFALFNIKFVLKYYVVGLYVAENLRVSQRHRKWLYFIPLLTSCLSLLPYVVGNAATEQIWQCSKIWFPVIVAISLYIFYWRGSGEEVDSSSDKSLMSRNLASAVFLFVVYSLLQILFIIYINIITQLSIPYWQVIWDTILNGLSDVFLYYVIWLYFAERLRVKWGMGRWVYVMPLAVPCLWGMVIGCIYAQEMIPSKMYNILSVLWMCLFNPISLLTPLAALSLYIFYRKRKSDKSSLFSKNTAPSS